MDKFEEILCEGLDVTYDSANQTVTFETELIPVTIQVCDLWHVARLLDRLDTLDLYDMQCDELSQEQKARAAVMYSDKDDSFDEDLFYRCAEKAGRKHEGK